VVLALPITVDLSAHPDTIAGDGLDLTTVQARILNDAGVLQEDDNTTVVRFFITEGEATVTSSEVAVQGGIAETALTSMSPGRLTIQAMAGNAQTSTVSVYVQTVDATRGAADFNGDRKVDFKDFLLFAVNFGRSQEDPGFDAKYDLDSDGKIGFQDFLRFASAFGRAL
jgi:hypothetical protein